MKKVLLIICAIFSLCVLGAGLAAWWQNYVAPPANPTVEWDAGVRDADVALTLLCAYDSMHSIDLPNWYKVLDINNPEDTAYYPPIGVSNVVVFPVFDVVNEVGANQEIWFSIAYVDASGNISEWLTVSHIFDYKSPNGVANFGVNQ